MHLGILWVNFTHSTLIFCNTSEVQNFGHHMTLFFLKKWYLHCLKKGCEKSWFHMILETIGFRCKWRILSAPLTNYIVPYFPCFGYTWYSIPRNVLVVETSADWKKALELIFIYVKQAEIYTMAAWLNALQPFLSKIHSLSIHILQRISGENFPVSYKTIYFSKSFAFMFCKIDNAIKYWRKCFLVVSDESVLHPWWTAS